MVFCSIQYSPSLFHSFIALVAVISLCILLRYFRQPYIIAYIFAGVILGKSGFNIVDNDALINEFGSFGLILLLFFIGMEVSLPRLIEQWRIPVIGTLVQVFLSVLTIWGLGQFLDWPFSRIIMLGFVISISSTAVVVKILQDKGQIDSNSGQSAISILLAQDIIIVPMLIVITYLSGSKPDTVDLLKQVVGGLLIVGIVVGILKKKIIRFPFETKISKDHEIQVFVSLSLCIGFALITSFFGLSSALGAFIAGMLVASTRSTMWVHESLHSFRVLFVAVFFISIGMLIDLSFFREHLTTILLLVLAVLVINNLINTFTLRLLGTSWRESIYIGSILAQIGEFSFILGATGYAANIINEYTYQLIISIISATLVASPLWIYTLERALSKNKTV